MLHFDEWTEFSGDWFTLKDINRGLASGAAHEGKTEAEGGMAMLEELNNTVGVEDMTAAKL